MGRGGLEKELNQQVKLGEGDKKMKTKLNLGAGLDIKESNEQEKWINVDFLEGEGIDVIHNLEEFPYPFKDNSIDYVLMDNSLEHLQDTIRVMEELHRICKPNAIVEIIVPHYTGAGAFQSLTHKRFFGSQTFNDLRPGNLRTYSHAEFCILENKLDFFSMRNWWWVRPIKLVINKIINIRPFWAERFLAYPLGGFDSVKFKLEVVK